MGNKWLWFGVSLIIAAKSGVYFLHTGAADLSPVIF
jgi:hypothetical protein